MDEAEARAAALDAWRNAKPLGHWHNADGRRLPPSPIPWQLDALVAYLMGKPMRIPSGRRAGHSAFFAVLENVVKRCDGNTGVPGIEWVCRENPHLDRKMVEEWEADFGVNPEAPPWPEEA